MVCDKFFGKQNYLEFVAKGLAEAREFRKSKKGEPRDRARACVHACVLMGKQTFSSVSHVKQEQDTAISVRAIFRTLR